MNNVYLIDALWPNTKSQYFIRNFSIILIGTILLAISAHVKIPIPPVPVTLQTLVVLVFAMSVGWKIAFITFAFYLFQGTIGLPVFATGGGIVYLTGPTAGYLYGMTIAAVVISYFADKGFSVSYIKTLISIILGSILIFTFGVLYLGSIIGYNKAIQAGLLPFIPSELFKIALAVILIPTFNKLLE